MSIQGKTKPNQKKSGFLKLCMHFQLFCDNWIYLEIERELEIPEKIN